MRQAYLTIDDSPSNQTGQLLDWLQTRNIQALFFCIGERLEANMDVMERAVAEGHILGNHSYTHPRSSLVGLDAMLAEIDRTETLIEQVYTQAGATRPARYFRFPHMDRGMGGYIVDFDALGPDERNIVVPLFRDGLNIALVPPTADQKHLRDRLQEGLSARGFVTPPFTGVTFPWYTKTEMGEAVDAMYTYSTSDWMLLPRHKGKWPWASVADLNRRADSDVQLASSQSRHIILAHDKDDLFTDEVALLQHLLDNDVHFVGYGF